MKSFVEKYRPQNLKDIVGNVRAIESLDQIEGKPTHLLFAGRQGTGKTTAAMALCRKLLGEAWRTDTLLLNSSMDRGIDTVRKKIRQFASTRALGDGFKVIILDEADNITRDAQQALRGTMEEYSSNVSFILTCNYPEKIIEPIRSRCKNFNFKPISIDQTVKLIAKVAAKEGIVMQPEVAERLAREAHGDMRQVLHDLEFLKKLNRPITKVDIMTLPMNELKEMSKLVLKPDFIEGRKRIFALMKDGVSAKDMINAIFDETNRTKMAASEKLSILIAIAETDRNIAMATNPEIQIIGLISKVAQVRR